jgi:integrase
MNKKITVTIECRAEFLRLRWNDGKRRSLSLGLRDTPPNRSQAGSIKRSIENDWASGLYDSSLFKYKPQTIGSNATDIKAPELFKRFTSSKLKENTISPHTASVRYWGIERVLETKLNKHVSSIDRTAAESLAEYFGQQLTPDVAKAQIGLLKSCWDWAAGSYQVVAVNPWLGLTGRFRLVDKREVEPFTSAEIQSIITGFKDSKDFGRYTDFVAFLFGIGCRIGEAVTLRWESVKPDYSSVWIGVSTTGKYKNTTTKTGKARTVILPPSIASMLKARRAITNPLPGDLVFPEPNGGSIDCAKFRQVWTKVLKSAGVPYRKPYSTRHTAISHALENGANPIDVAGQCGHDVATMFDRYSHVIQQKQVFVEFDR